MEFAIEATSPRLGHEWSPTHCGNHTQVHTTNSSAAAYHATRLFRRVVRSSMRLRVLWACQSFTFTGHFSRSVCKERVRAFPLEAFSFPNSAQNSPMLSPYPNVDYLSNESKFKFRDYNITGAFRNGAMGELQRESRPQQDSYNRHTDNASPVSRETRWVGTCRMCACPIYARATGKASCVRTHGNHCRRLVPFSADFAITISLTGWIALHRKAWIVLWKVAM